MLRVGRCSFHLECLAFSRVGLGDTLWPVRTFGRKQVVSSRHSVTGGRCVMRARLVLWRSGSSGMGASAVDRKSKFWGCYPSLRTLTHSIHMYAVLDSLPANVRSSPITCVSGREKIVGAALTLLTPSVVVRQQQQFE